MFVLMDDRKCTSFGPVLTLKADLYSVMQLNTGQCAAHHAMWFAQVVEKKSEYSGFSSLSQPVLRTSTSKNASMVYCHSLYQEHSGTLITIYHYPLESGC